MFPLNTWYVAATPAEIDGKPLGRKICNKSMVFFRGPNGVVAAMEDFCPHRGAPLSLGRVEEGKLICGYHGLEMGCDGKTHSMPGQRVRGFPPIKTYPTVEKYGFIWVWPGDPAKADPALGREPGLGLRGRSVLHPVRLPADDRQPDGSDARDVRTLHQHRPEGNRRSRPDHPHRGRPCDHRAAHGKHLCTAVLARRVARQ